MTANVVSQQVWTPSRLDEALEFMAEHRGEGWRPLAGGTDVMVQLYRDGLAAGRWINLTRLRPSLSGIEWFDQRLRIGALATMSDLRQSELLHAACPLIGQAAAAVGAVQVQNRATVGGNIVNGSPAGDTLPVWLALDAHLELASVRGTRTVPFQQFMTGYRRSILEPDELLTAITFTPRHGGGQRYYFRKVAPRVAQGISKLVFAGMMRIVEGTCRDVRLAFGSMAAMTRRARAAELRAEGNPVSLETGEAAARTLTTDLAPIDDARSTADYRLRVARNLVREFLAGNL